MCMETNNFPAVESISQSEDLMATAKMVISRCVGYALGTTVPEAIRFSKHTCSGHPDRR